LNVNITGPVIEEPVVEVIEEVFNAITEIEVKEAPFFNSTLIR
jgi:hypothetical protein